MKIPRRWTDAGGAPAATQRTDAGVFSVDLLRAVVFVLEGLQREP